MRQASVPAMRRPTRARCDAPRPRRSGLRLQGGRRARLGAALSLVLSGCMLGCSPWQYRRDADRTAYAIIGEAQKRALGKAEPFTVESSADALRRKLLLGQSLPYTSPASLGADELSPIGHWPEKDYPQKRENPPGEAPWSGKKALRLSLRDALGVAARNSRDYQTRKETVFQAALALDVEANEFRNLLFGDGDSTYSVDLSGTEAVRGLATTGTLSWERQLKGGTLLTAGFAIDLVKLLTQDRASSLGLFADATITIPLLRGAGRHIVAEPLTQAERNVAYALWDFERYKRTLAVSVASSYLDVLRQLDQVQNSEANYKRLIAGTRRARRLAGRGRGAQQQPRQQAP